MTRYLSVAEIIALHHEIMFRTDAQPSGIRDLGLLESALMRPQMAKHYEDADLIAQAALLAVGISQAQAFIDGNKRTAFVACDVFLRLNAVVFSGGSLKLAQCLEQIAERSLTLEEFTSWLREHV